VELPRYGRAAQAAARDKRTLMQNAIAKAEMLDTNSRVPARIGLTVEGLHTKDAHSRNPLAPARFGPFG
jgi:hypothetical protein